MKFLNGWEKGLKSKKREMQEQKELLNELKKETEFEKGDLFALIIAALVTILPVVLVILFLYYAITMFFFG